MAKMSQRSRRSVILLLVATHVVANALFSYQYAPVAPGPSGGLAPFFIFGLWISQASLLVLWSGLGRSRWCWRIPGTFAGAIACAICCHFSMENAFIPRSELIVIVVWPALLVLGTALAMRWMGCTVLDSDSLTGLPASLRIRFSISELMVFTAVTAVLLVGIKYVLLLLKIQPTVVNAVLMYGPSAAIACLLMLWLTLATSHIWWRLISIPVVVAIGAAWYCLFRAGDDIGLLLGSCSVITAATLLILRLCGYRLVAERRGPAAGDVLS